MGLYESMYCEGPVAVAEANTQLTAHHFTQRHSADATTNFTSDASKASVIAVGP